MNQYIGTAIGLFIVLGALFALWKGRTPERLVAAVVIVDEIIARSTQALSLDVEPTIRLLTDGLSALALLALTIRYGSTWMGAMMFFFAAQFAMHSYYMVTERPSDYFHALVNNVNWSAITWCLIIGTAMAWRQRIRAARALSPKQPAP